MAAGCEHGAVRAAGVGPPVLQVHAPVRSGFDIHSREEGEARIAAAYAENRLRVSGNPQRFRMTQDRLDVGPIQIDNCYATLRHDIDVEPLESLCVIRVLERTVEIQTPAHSARAYPGDSMLITLPGEGYHARVDGARIQATSLRFSLLDQVTNEPGAGVRRRYRTTPVPPAAARHWQRTVDYLTGNVFADGAPVTPLVLGAAGRLLAATFLTVFDPEAVDDQPSDRADATPQAVRRAIAYIEANPDLDLGVADIARASHVSVRSLQLAFRRHLDTTPMRYLRRVRLDLARKNLQQASRADGATVTDVAARWGYADLSRFAVDYRAAYGEHPHVTLRRRGD